MLIQKQFIDLVNARRPRAYVVLAHYVKLLARFDMSWVIGDTGESPGDPKSVVSRLASAPGLVVAEVGLTRL